MGEPDDHRGGASARKTLRDEAERLRARCYRAADVGELRAVFDDAAALCARHPRSPQAARSFRVASVTLTYGLLRASDGAGLVAHLAALDRLHEALARRPAVAQVYGHALATVAREPACLDVAARGDVLARAEALHAAHPQDGLVLASCADATEALTAGDPDAMVRLARSLRRKVDRAPDDTGLRGRWAWTAFLCTDRLRRKKRWGEIAPWRDQLARDAESESTRALVALDLARATRNVALDLAANDDLPGLAREVDALRALRDEATGRRDLRRREFVVEWAVGAKSLVVAYGEQSWCWGAGRAEPVAEACEHLDRAEAQLAAMWSAATRTTMTRATDLLAEAIQDFTWCARVARDDAREARWHARLTRLVARRPRSAAERYWALSVGSRALSLVDRGDLDGAIATAESVVECAGRRDDAVTREALGKALCAIEKARRLRGEPEPADASVDALEALLRAHLSEAMLMRFFVNGARSRAEAWLAAGDCEAAWRWAQRVDALTSLPPGEGLGRRVFAQVLQAIARGSEAHADEARARLARLAAENPTDDEITVAARASADPDA